jgi:hypothetical protein
MKEPIYISRPLLDAERLAAYAEAIGLQNVVAPADMHVTLAYSKTRWIGVILFLSLTVPAWLRMTQTGSYSY